MKYAFLSFNFCKNDIIGKYFKHSVISCSNRMTYMHQMYSVVKLRVQKDYLKTLPSFFDGCSCSNTPYDALFAAYLSKIAYI